MKEHNKYHKFKAYGQKKSGNEFETMKYPFYFDYYETALVQSSGYMFKNLVFQGESTKLITQQNRGLEANDRIVIDGSAGLITKVHTVEENTLGGQRFQGRRKTYIIEVEM